MKAEPLSADRAPLGIAGFDDVLCGGLLRNRLYLLEGSPGTGKTTIALQFLMEGAKQGETSLFITMSETAAELREGAASHGWTLDERINVFELAPGDSLLDENRRQSLLHSSDLELSEATRRMFAEVERVRPSLVVIDSLSEIRLLAENSLRFRRQVLAFKHYFGRLGATVLMLDDLTAENTDKTLHSTSHGVFRLEELTPAYGAERRRLRVLKYRGQAFRGGYHDFTIKHGGVSVFPRLVAAEHRGKVHRSQMTSGIAGLDSLLGGGIEAGSSTLLLGPAGSGKSLLTLQFVMAAVGRGEKAALFVFDEELGLLFDRAKGMGIDLEAAVATGNLFVEQQDAAEMSPGEFANKVTTLVANNGIRTVVIDSLNGYQSAMPEEGFLILHIHELLQYLNRNGATTFLTVAQHGLVGEMKAPVDVTYLADAVVLLRYFEVRGRVRRAISVIKKRTGFHEDTIREFQISGRGLSIGPALDQFHGVLKGVPDYVGGATPLLDTKRR